MFLRKPKSKKVLLVAVASPAVISFGPLMWYGKWKLDRAVADKFKLISNRRERLYYRLFFGLYIKVNEINFKKASKLSIFLKFLSGKSSNK